LSRHAALALLASLALAAGCGGDDDDDASGAGGSGAGNAAQIEQAEAAMKNDDYDGALKILEGAEGAEARRLLAEYRVEAARETLANAQRKDLKTEPRAAMSLAETSLRYQPTPEARAFLAKATRAHAVFKRSGRDDD
jgi:hypothetical protein